MIGRAGLLAMSLLGALFAGVGEAQQPPAPPEVPPEPSAPELREQEEALVGPTPGSPTVGLAEAVSIAIEHNFGLLGAADSVQAARLRESATKAQFYPKLTPRYQHSSDNTAFGLDLFQKLPWSGASLTATGTLSSIPQADSPTARSSDLRLILTQPLLRGFGPNATYFDLVNSRRGLEGQERNFELARQRLAIQVTSAFYAVVAQRQLLTVSRQSLKRSESLLRASEARLKIGLVSKLDVFRAQIQASQTSDSLVRSEAALQTALEQFRFLLGLAPSHPLEPEGVTLEEMPPDQAEPLEVLVARALEKRLDLKEIRDLVKDAERTASLTKQSLLPQLDVSLNVSQLGFGPSYSDALRTGDTRVSVSLSTSYSLERSAEKVAAAVADIDVQARQRAVTQKEMEVEADVRAALRELDRIRKSVELQRQGVEVAAQQRRLANLRYQRGLASNFDVVDAEGSLVLARSALVGLLASYQVALVELRRATGVLDVTREFTP
jgi:outer membrane protein TolC